MRNLSDKEWHSAIIGNASPQQVAERLNTKLHKLWANPMLENTREENLILELGSGTAELSGVLTKNGRKAFLVDINPKTLKFGKAVFKSANITGQFICANVLNKLPFKDEIFDCVFSSGLLEHFDYTEQLFILREAFRVSRKHIITLVPNANSFIYQLGKWYQEHNKIWQWGKENPMFTMKNLFEEVGLKNIKEYSIDPEHALEFISCIPKSQLIKKIILQWYHSISITELNKLNQGYLLVTKGEKQF